MNKIIVRFFLTVVMMTLVACSSAVIKPETLVSHQSDKVLYAKGYSQLRNAQNQFVIEQVAKTNAYRGLAKQLYNEKLMSNLLVANQVIKDEAFRIYLDLFLREARVVESKFIADQKSVVLALSLTPRFYHCVSSTVALVKSCLREDDKIQFTRIGYQQAALSTVSLSCSDCSSQLSVSGFSKEKSALDREMLNLGLYDAQWVGNVGIAAAIRYFQFTRFF